MSDPEDEVRANASGASEGAGREKMKTEDTSFEYSGKKAEDEKNGSRSNIEDLRHGDGLSNTEFNEAESNALSAAPIEKLERKATSNLEDKDSGGEGELEAGILSSVKNRRRKVVSYVDNENNAPHPKKKLLKGEDALMCHQCQRNDKGEVVRCMNCKRKRFCFPCMNRWYPQLTPDDFATMCPFCQGNCNCKSCLRMRGIKEPPKRKILKEDKLRNYLYVLHLLLPWFKELRREQQMEKEVDARVKGLPLTEIKVQLAPCEKDERVFCNYCSTSIADYHRSCPDRKSVV